jgi:hypothetical protein
MRTLYLQLTLISPMFLGGQVCCAQPLKTNAAKPKLELFIGTWKLDIGQSKIDAVGSVIEKQADGSVHIDELGDYTFRLNGPESDLMSKGIPGERGRCSELNARMWECKFTGPIEATLRRKLSPDGNIMRVTLIGVMEGGKTPYSLYRELQRDGVGEGFYGKWMRTPNDSILFADMQSAMIGGDGIRMRFEAPAGGTLTISGKLDATDNSVDGQPGLTVALRGINSRTFVATFKRDRKLEETDEFTSSTDGKTIIETDRGPDGKVTVVQVYRKR